MEQYNNTQSVIGALGYPVLPQSVVRTPRTERTVQRTQYDPNKLNAVLAALQKPRSLKTRGEVIAEVLAETPEARSFKGGYGEEIINPWAMGLSSFARAFGAAYKSKKQDEREKELEDRENALKAAQIAMDADKSAITEKYIEDYMKVNDPNAGTDVAYRFEPSRIAEMKKLNDEAGRWATEWGKGMSDMINTDASKAYNEFEGKAKQYVQDQLKKIYGAQMTEQEGERFFKSMGLSPYLDPELRWNLVENALDDLARKNGTTIKQNQMPMTAQLQKGQIVDGYEFLGGDPADEKNWRAK